MTLYIFILAAPTITTFKEIQKMWSTINKQKRKVLKISTKCKDIIGNRKTELVDFYKSVLSTRNMRGDYREAAELSLMLLGHGEELTLKKPGCDSNARWMAKILYAAKKFMLTKNDPGMQSKLKEFLIFVVFIYLPSWFKAPFITEASTCDLQMAADLQWYVNIMLFLDFVLFYFARQCTFHKQFSTEMSHLLQSTEF